MLPMDSNTLAVYAWERGISQKLKASVAKVLTRGELEVASQLPPVHSIIYALFERKDRYISIQALDDLPVVLKQLTSRPHTIIEFKDPLFQLVCDDGQNTVLAEGDNHCAIFTDALIFRVDFIAR